MSLMSRVTEAQVPLPWVIALFAIGVLMGIRYGVNLARGKPGGDKPSGGGK